MIRLELRKAEILFFLMLSVVTLVCVCVATTTSLSHMHEGITSLLLSDSTQMRIQNLKNWFTFNAIKSKPKQVFKFRKKYLVYQLCTN